MAVPNWTTDLSSFWTADTAAATVTHFTLTGGPTGAGTNPETDYYVQGGATPSSISKNAFAASTKGFIVDNLGTTFTVPTDGIVLAWGIFTAVGSLNTKASGGLRIAIGSSATVYNQYYVGGSDTLIFESWVPYVIDPNTATPDAGTETTNWRWIGIIAALPTGGPSKGAPLAIDAMRYGRHTLTYTDGDVTFGYNTFALAEATANSLANRWGNIEFNKGSYFIQGFHSFGSSGTPVDFRDQNKVIFIRDSGGNNVTNDAVSTAYNRLEIINTNSNVDWTNITFQALGTRARGVFVHAAGTFDAVSCQFIDMDTFSLLSTSVMTSCIFRRTNAITAPGSNMTGSTIATPTVAADASALVWAVTTDTSGKLNDMTFSKGTNAHHAIQIGDATTLGTSYDLNGIVFTDFVNTVGDNAAPLYIPKTTGSVTINLVGCTGITTSGYKSGGATVTIVTGSRTIKIAVTKVGGVVTGANVFLAAASGGPFPYQASVTSITRSGTTATVTHASVHGLADNDKVLLAGITDKVEDNAVQTIDVTGTTTYTYQTTASGSADYTGTKTSTFVFLKGLAEAGTDLNEISMSRAIPSSQPVTGWARKSTSDPYYKEGAINGTVLSTGDTTFSPVLIDDD